MCLDPAGGTYAATQSRCGLPPKLRVFHPVVVLRGGGILGGNRDLSEEYWKSMKNQEEEGRRGFVDRIVNLLKQGLNDFDIVKHPDLRGWQASAEVVGKLRAEWVHKGGRERAKKEKEDQEKISEINKKMEESLKEEVGEIDGEARLRRELEQVGERAVPARESVCPSVSESESESESESDR
jgi:hypothetical protein